MGVSQAAHVRPLAKPRVGITVWCRWRLTLSVRRESLLLDGRSNDHSSGAASMLEGWLYSETAKLRDVGKRTNDGGCDSVKISRITQPRVAVGTRRSIPPAP